MYASPGELSRWLGREAGVDVPVHSATENMDLFADLKRALSYARAGNKRKDRNTNKGMSERRLQPPGDSLAYLIRLAMHFSQLLPQDDLCWRPSLASKP